MLLGISQFISITDGNITMIERGCTRQRDYCINGMYKFHFNYYKTCKHRDGCNNEPAEQIIANSHPTEPDDRSKL